MSGEMYPVGWFKQKLPSSAIQMRIINDLTSLYSGKKIGHWHWTNHMELPIDYGKYPLDLAHSAQ